MTNSADPDQLAYPGSTGQGLKETGSKFFPLREAPILEVTMMMNSGLTTHQPMRIICITGSDKLFSLELPLL